MTALVTLKDEQSYDQIERIFETTDNPRVAIHGANALAGLGGRENMIRILRRSVDSVLGAGVRDELLTAAATMVGAESQLYRFLRRYNMDREQGVAEVLPDINTTFDRRTITKIEYESTNGHSGLKHFPRALRETARRADGEYGGALAEFLDEYRPERFPRRLAFSLAIMLSCVREPDWEVEEGRGGALGPAAQ
jgi:hypothetical protein